MRSYPYKAHRIMAVKCKHDLIYYHVEGIRVNKRAKEEPLLRSIRDAKEYIDSEIERGFTVYAIVAPFIYTDDIGMIICKTNSVLHQLYISYEKAEEMLETLPNKLNFRIVKLQIK